MPLDLHYVADSTQVTDDEIVCAFATLMSAMRKRAIIRTNNVVGDLGERYAVLAYEQNPDRKPIHLFKTNTADVDAGDANGRSYAIKAASPASTKTSAFHLEQERTADQKAFDYLVVVQVDDLMRPKAVYELTWEYFWTTKRWSKRQNAWFLPLTKGVLRGATLIYQKNENS